MVLELNAICRRDPDGGFVAYVAELPGGSSQGETLDDPRVHLRAAVALILEVTRARAEEASRGAEIIRERLLGEAGGLLSKLFRVLSQHIA